MLLKITKKIIRRNVFEQTKKKPGLSVNHAFEQLRPVEHLLHVPYIYKPDALWPMSPQIITSLQNLSIMRHRLNRGFAARNPSAQNMP